MSRYEGCRTKAGPIVTVDAELLDPRLDLRNHSPTGFEWGYGGSGPAQLALAILADHLSDEEQALNLYHRFKWLAIAGLPKKGWVLTPREIDLVLHSIREQDAVGGAL